MASNVDGSTPKTPSKGEGGMKSFFRVYHYADSLSWTLNVIAFLAAIAAGTALPLMDIVFGKFTTVFNNFAIGRISPDEFRTEIDKWTLYFLYLFAAKFALVYIYTVSISVAATRTTKALRITFLEQMLRQDIAFFESPETGSASQQVTTNCNLVNQGISEKLALGIQGVATFVTAFVVAFAVQWKLALITFSIIPTIVIVISISVGIDTKQESMIMGIYSKAGVLAEEVFASMRTVHAFWLQPSLSRKYEGLLEDAERVGMKKSPNYAVMFSTEFFCTYSGFALAFWQGTRMYASGEVTEPGDVVTVIFVIIVAATAMTSIAPQIIQITKAASAAGELFKTIDRTSDIDALSDAGKRLDGCSGSIEVRDLRFAYPARPDVEVLKGLNLTIPARKTTALVGASGSGKSTIVGLLERWYNAEGTLTLDGVDLRDINIRWLRTTIRSVQQEPVLFNGTVFENVSHGLLGTSAADLPAEKRLDLVKEACRASYAEEFIEKLPKKYDTQIGERAMMLSGGQKQRLAIARSIISDPQVLLLDEATSALDPKAESVVQKALDRVSANRTTVVIAHKLSTVRNADSIAVLSQGVVVEQGTHDELLAADGPYARLVTSQDLGHNRPDQPEAADADMVERGLSLARTVTRPQESKQSESDHLAGMNYSLVRCLWILLREIRELWLAFGIIAVVCIAGGLTFPAQAILFSQSIKAFQLTGSDQTSTGDFYALMFFVVALGNLVAYALLGWFTNMVAQVIARRFRLELFNHVLRQDLDFFNQPENATGALVSRLSEQVTHLQELLGFNIALILIGFVNLFSSCVLALIVGWKLGLVVAFGGLPVLVFFGYLRVRLEFKLDDATTERFAKSAALAAESVAAIRTVASLTMERYIVDQYRDALSNVARTATKALVWTMFWYSLSQSTSFLAMALGFWYGARLLSTGEYDTTQFFIVFIGVIFSGEAAAQFFGYTTSITKGQRAANHILWFRKQQPSIRGDSAHDNDENKESSDPARIDCDDLDFAYSSRPNAKVLQGVNVKIHPGQFVAFVGPSGCGKTTLIALLERFYDPIAGTIALDGRPITALDPRRYRRQLALVQQEPVLYQGSIRDNIAMGLDSDGAEHGVSDDQIADACRAANINDFIASLPEGLATLCGKSGAQLSGGQRQRVAIARALIREPRLLLLDEATSALDTESERIVQAALEKAKSGRTTVAVAHRLSTIKDADAIMVFERGSIVESGTHAQLLARRGVYYEMCLGQSLDREVT